MQQVSYTTINHEARKQLGLSMNEYAVADMIYHLSHNPKCEVPGWCYASREAIGEFIGISKRAVIDIIQKLIEFGVVDKSNETKFLRTTNRWYSAVISGQELHPDGDICTAGEETSPKVQSVQNSGEETSPDAGEETSPNNNIINNYINNNNPLYSPIQEKTKKRSELNSITEDDIFEISEKYHASVTFVKIQYEKLKNYCQSHGRRYKDYKAALRNFVVGEMTRMAERRGTGDDRYRAIDATTI